MCRMRGRVAVVEQNPTLFNTSIYENIVFGMEGTVDVDDVHRAAMDAEAHEFIMATEDGYDTQVGPQGARLSGGQIQRIAIARALLRRPKVHIHAAVPSLTCDYDEGVDIRRSDERDACQGGV